MRAGVANRTGRSCHVQVDSSATEGLVSDAFKELEAALEREAESARAALYLSAGTDFR